MIWKKSFRVAVVAFFAVSLLSPGLLCAQDKQQDAKPPMDAVESVKAELNKMSAQNNSSRPAGTATVKAPDDATLGDMLERLDADPLSLARGLYAYHQEERTYPAHFWQLTTPIAYLSAPEERGPWFRKHLRHPGDPSAPSDGVVRDLMKKNPRFNGDDLRAAMEFYYDDQGAYPHAADQLTSPTNYLDRERLSAAKRKADQPWEPGEKANAAKPASSAGGVSPKASAEDVELVRAHLRETHSNNNPGSQAAIPSGAEVGQMLEQLQVTPRELLVGMESYYVDNNALPTQASQLTTPVAFVTMPEQFPKAIRNRLRYPNEASVPDDAALQAMVNSVKGGERVHTLSKAMDAYYEDHKKYPSNFGQLTTPVGYIKVNQTR